MSETKKKLDENLLEKAAGGAKIEMARFTCPTCQSAPVELAANETHFCPKCHVEMTKVTVAGLNSVYR